MRGCSLVEPIVALYAFSAFLIYPIGQQYVYRRLWVQLTNTTYPISDNTTRCSTNSSENHSNLHEEVQRHASLFSLYSELVSTIPSLIVTLLLVTYSDRGGRKVAIIPPLFGTLLYTLVFLAVSYFELNIYFLIGASLLSSLFGGLSTFLGGCFAYIADLCHEDHQRTMRMTGLEVMIGLFSGGAAISTGFFLRAAGFNWPFITAAICLCVVLLYAILILEETVTKPPDDCTILNESPRRPGFKQLVCGIYSVYSEANDRCRIVLTLLILIFASLCLAHSGAMSLITLFELNQPLCWTEIFIGYGVALSTTVFLGSYVGVRAFTYCGLPQLVIIMLGILSVVVGMVMTAFTKTTIMMFLIRVPMLLSIMPFPVMRSILSKIISRSKQGALFACISFLESLMSTISNALFQAVYAATVAWFPGFVFLLSAALCVIPLSVLGVLALIGTDVPDEVQRAESVPSEEDPAKAQSDRSPIL